MFIIGLLVQKVQRLLTDGETLTCVGPTHRRYLDVEDNMTHPPTQGGHVALILAGRDGGE